MRTRKNILEAGTTRSVTRVLRTRKKIEPVDREGEVVEVNLPELALSLLKTVPRNTNTFRVGSYLHVSDLLGKCVRKMAISYVYDVAMPSQPIQESLALTFAQGTAIHDHIKSRMFSGHAGKMFGSWSCKCGDLHTKPSLYHKVQNKRCSICGGAPINYNELELRDTELMLVGSPDITLYLDEYRAYYPIEIKSINHEEWKELARPKPDHVLQVLFYWYLLKKLGYPVTTQVSILYVTKGFIFKSPYKEFIVFPESNISRLDEYLEEARALRDARNNVGIPIRSVCATPDTKTAKECHVCNICFQLPGY